MRNVPELRFDGFVGDWDSRRLKSLIKDIGTGSSKFNFIEGRYPILGSTGIIGYDNQFDYDGKFILIARVGANAGILYKYNGKVKISDNTIFIKTKNQEYIYNLLLKKDLTRLVFGSGQPLVKSSDLKDLHVIYTKNEEEQDKIGELFRKIDALIEIQEGKVSKMEDFKKSMLQKMFPKKDELVPEFRFDGFADNYNEAYLLDIGENIKGSTYSKKDTEEDYGNSQLIHYGMIFTEYSSIITESPYKVIEKPNSVKSKVGDLIMPASSTTSDNEIVSASAVAKEGIIYGGDINIIRTNDIDLALYLSYYITGTELKNLIFKNVQGTTIHHLYFSSLKNIKVKLPPAEEQRSISRFFRNIEKEIAVEERLLDSYKIMKKSLLQKMFV